jgi:hypothetical protein
MGMRNRRWGAHEPPLPIEILPIRQRFVLCMDATTYGQRKNEQGTAGCLADLPSSC